MGVFKEGRKLKETRLGLESGLFPTRLEAIAGRKKERKKQRSYD